MRVAAVQTTAGPDRRQNLEDAGDLVEQAARAGAELVVLPEYFSVAGSPEHLRTYAETLTGPTVTWASELASQWKVHILAGSVPERPVAAHGPDRDPEGRIFNTSCLLGPTGALEAVYRKVHLFDVELEGVPFRESATIAPGDQLCVTPLGRSSAERGPPTALLGLSICYDLRFPEIFRIMTLGGATVIAVPAAFTAATGPSHWELLLRARAAENQVFVIGAAQVGDLPPGMPTCHGHSMIVDPWGTVIAELGGLGPGVILADLDFEGQRRIRSQLPVLANRRPAAYRWPHDDTWGTAERQG
ncbi:MAG TPA: carbon-nitrogen hydrolase family protein [Acidimicrobiales bacterium]